MANNKCIIIRKGEYIESMTMDGKTLVKCAEGSWYLERNTLKKLSIKDLPMDIIFTVCDSVHKNYVTQGTSIYSISKIEADVLAVDLDFSIYSEEFTNKAKYKKQFLITKKILLDEDNTIGCIDFNEIEDIEKCDNVIFIYAKMYITLTQMRLVKLIIEKTYQDILDIINYEMDNIFHKNENMKKINPKPNYGVNPGKAIPTEIKLQVWKRDKGSCARCGNIHNLRFDHIISREFGGSSTHSENIQILCDGHNLSKGSRIL